MKRKLLSVLLVLAMALTLLPTAAFAAGETAGTTAPKVAGYGFVWDAEKYKGDSAEKLTGGFNAGSDWMGETMYVAFAENGLANGTNLWFEVTVGTDPNADVWGCAATATAGKNMFAFSFLNRGTQWEQHPTIDGETFDYTGANVTHAKSYMKAGSATLKVYTPTQPITGAQVTTPSDLGDAVFERTISITEKNDVMEVVQDPAVVITDADVILGNFNAALTDDNKPYTGTPDPGTPTFKAATDTAPITITVSPTVEGLKAHPTEGTDTADTTKVKPWVGIGVPQPATGVTVKYYAGWGTPATTGTDTNPDNTQEANSKTYDTFYWGVTEEHKTAKDKGYLAAVYSATGKADVTVYYVLDFTNVTLAGTPSAAGLTFGAIPNESGNVKIYGKAIANLGAFAFTTGGTTIKVTGSANYIKDYTEFSSVTEEQKGHYLPIQIKGTAGQKITITGSKTKELTFGSDESFELIMHLDEIFTKDEPVDPNVRVAADKVGKFTVALEGGPTYTIDCTGITLAAPPTVDDSGKTSVKVEATDDLADLIKDSVETTTDENAPVKVETEGSNKTLTFAPKTEGANDTMTSANKAEVTLPTGLITAVTTGTDTKANVKVETAAGSVTVPTATLNTDAAKSGGVSLVVSDSKIGLKDKTLAIDNGTIDLTVATTIKDATTGVTVTATVGNGGALASVDKKVTVTITGLDKDKNYIVFCITSDNKVTYVGETKPTAKGTIPVETPHLTSFVAVEKTEALAAKVTSMPTEDAKGAAGAKLSTTPVSTTSTYTRSTDALNLVTITGKANTYYIIQATNAKNAAPGLIYCVKAGSDGKAEVRCNASSVLLVLEGTTTPPSLKNGIPDSGLTEVNEA